MSGLTMVSLFDGIGGFPEAFRRTGVRTVATCEIDKAAAGVAADHFPDAKQFEDVTKVSGVDLRATGFDPKRGVLTGGWPCQDISLAGRRLGLGGARSGLFWEIVRLAADLRPRWLVLENVPGLLSAVCSCPGLGVCGDTCADPHVVRGGACGPGRCMELHGGAMGAVLGALAELGYGLAYRVLDAQHFGVPQRRRRVVIVGCLGDWAAPAQVLLEPEGRGGNPSPGGEEGPSIADVADDGAAGGRREVVSTLQSGGTGARGHRIDAEGAAGGHLIVNALTRNGLSGLDDNTAQGGQVVAYSPEVWQQQGSKLQPMGTMRRGNGNVTGGVPFLAQPITAREGKGPDSDVTSGNVVTHALTAEGADASEDGSGRGTPLVGFDLAQITSGKNRSNPKSGDPQPPLAATGQLHVAPVAAVRRLTPVECERLQGFPDGWTATSYGRPQSDSARYRQLGNSIAVPVFAWVARRIVAAEDAQ